jgi:hypothetical protein
MAFAKPDHLRVDGTYALRYTPPVFEAKLDADQTNARGALLQTMLGTLGDTP